MLPQNSSDGWGRPVSSFTHLFFRIPPNNCNPAIAKIKKKKISTIIVSLRRGTDFIRDYTIIFNPSILWIDLKGLNTLNDLRPDRFTPPPYKKNWRYPVDTITKSSAFQGSLRYEPLPRMKPKPRILRTISTVYRARNKLSRTS